MGCRMTKKSKKKMSPDGQVNDNGDVCPPDLNQLKRRDLQKLCKKLKIRAVGKNIDLIERIQSHYNQLELKEVNSNKVEDSVQDLNDCDEGDHVDKVDEVEEVSQVEEVDKVDEVDTVSNEEQHVEDIDVSVKSSPNNELNKNEDSSPDKPLSNASSPKDWSWVARWCVVDGVLKQDAKERWVLLQLVGGRTVLINDKTDERVDFVLEPTILPTPETYEDNYICGDCVRKNNKQLSGWIGIKKTSLVETPKSSLGKENCNNNDSLLRQSFKRKREEVLSPRSVSDFIELVDSPMKVRRLNPNRSSSPASPRDRRERGEDFQLPKNLLKPWRPKKTKNTPPKEDPDFAQKVEKIISHLSPDEQLSLVFGGKKPSVLHSPQQKTSR